MEIPRIWREQPTRVRFEGWFKENKETGLVCFKFPGGEIPMVGSQSQIFDRLERAGFDIESITEIMNLFDLQRVASETSISTGVAVQGLYQQVRAEVGK
jgi:hypothetical protein